jgi:hypothetical protein
VLVRLQFASAGAAVAAGAVVSVAAAAGTVVLAGGAAGVLVAASPPQADSARAAITSIIRTWYRCRWVCFFTALLLE